MKLYRRGIFLLCLLFYSYSLLYSKENIFGVSLNYPGIGIKYFYHTKNIFELRLQYFHTDDYTTTLFGLRYYRIFPIAKNNNLFYYLGAEGSFFTHNENYLSSNESQSANGWLVGSYLGIEKFLSKKFSLNFDIGPYIATATINNYSSSLFDFVLNVSINYYLRK